MREMTSDFRETCTWVEPWDWSETRSRQEKNKKLPKSNEE